jgi:non-ribosomal peptide synthetase component F
MNDRDARPDGVARQHAIRAKCVHPSGAVVPFEPRDLEQSIPALFARSARRFRDRVAVKTATQVLTYGELEQASDRLAQAILARRGPEPVALVFDKSAALIVSILGVLKAGKIYMPVSPAFPELRLQQTLGDVRPGLLVTDRAHLAQAESIARDRCEVLDRDGLSTGPPTVERPPTEVEPDRRPRLSR